ncbi:lysozyme [Pontibacter beigongshangensis]|uniref:lysozyme n=1 Tax=Pontibacter beigongshangensis TaxID=2574733 RepID=UPI00164F2222|nr:lysozyme [Pontibacter beigongshangensis]
MNKHLKTNPPGLALIHEFESCRLEAYLCPAGIWTIGWGCTFYEDGTRVKKGDRISKKQAEDLFKTILPRFEEQVRKAVTAPLTLNQFSALVSFTFNCGEANLKKSTLLKKVNANPADRSIAAEFAKWKNGGGRELPGLVRRRKAESDLYFS